jgi:hypothetical protein
MPINPNLLVAAAMLQDYIVRKDDGLPLTNGIITLYKDTARSFYKNWYYQTGSPGAYTYIALDNPLTLSSAGTIQDPNGNDVIPFYYPFQEDDENVREAYYITVYDSDQDGNPTVLQFTRENFPFEPAGGGGPTSINPTFRNYILNNIYWRNAGPQDLMTVTDMVIAPSQHDGYTNGDIRFLKNVAGANDDLAFLPMTAVLDEDITPEYYLNMQCTASQAGETVKCIQYPISLHVDTLQNVLATLVIQAQNVAGNTNNFLDIQIYQYLGSGALTQPDPVLVQRITLNNNFQKFVLSFIFPDATGLVLGSGGDDALFLRIQYPLSTTFQINHTKPQLYLSTDVPDNDFDTYDQVETIINSPRTGDVKISLAGKIFSTTYQSPGYVAMNDGTIGNASSNATARKNIDTWPLYRLLWDTFSFANIGTANTLAQLFDSTGAPVAYGVTAIADFNANKAISLTKQLGRTLIGTVPTNLAVPSTLTNVYTASNNGGNILLSLTTPNPTIYVGMPIVFTNVGGTLPGNITNGVFYVSTIVSTSQFWISTTYANALARVLVPFTSAGTAVNTVNFSVEGAPIGEYAHTQSIAELAAHQHTTSPNFSVTNASAGGGVNAATAAAGTPTGITGSSQPFNVVQPSTYLNMFIKL